MNWKRLSPGHYKSGDYEVISNMNSGGRVTAPWTASFKGRAFMMVLRGKESRYAKSFETMKAAKLFCAARAKSGSGG